HTTTTKTYTLSLHDALPISHRIEDVKLRLGPVVRGGGDSRLDEVLLRFLRHVARIARVALTRHRVGHVTRERKGRDFETRIDEGDRKSTRLNSSHVAISYAV